MLSLAAAFRDALPESPSHFAEQNASPLSKGAICGLRRTLASLSEGGGFCEAKDGGSVPSYKRHSPSHGLRRDSPLREGAKGA